MRLRLTFAAMLLAILPAAPARAAPAWLQAKAVSDTATDGGDVAVNASGTAAAAWTAIDFTNPPVLGVSVHRPGTDWQRATVPSLPGLACDPQVAVDDAGALTVVWRQLDAAPGSLCNAAGDSTIYAAVTVAGGNTFGTPVPVSGAGDLRNLRLAANGAGAAVAGWARFSGSAPGSIEAATRLPGAPFVPVTVEDFAGGGLQLADLDVAVDTGGTAAAVWVVQRMFSGDFDAEARVHPPAGTWGVTPQPVSPANDGATVSDTAVSFEPGSRDLHLVWGETRTGAGTRLCDAPSGSTYAVCAIRRSANGVWQPVQLVTTTPMEPRGVAVRSGGGDRSAAAWMEPSYFVRVATRPGGALSTWGGVQYVPDPPVSTGTTFVPAVGVGPDGTAIAAWGRFGGGAGRDASISAPGAAWTAPEAIASGTGDAGDVVFDAAGNAVVGLVGSGQMEVAARDASGPDLAPSIPATAVAGQPVTVAVQAVDRWSALGAPAVWSYGDGTAPTTATTHVYAAAGTYSISVAQADALGNVGTAGGQTSIVPPPVILPALAPSLGLRSATFAVTWRESVPRGRLVLRGQAEAAATVTGALVRPGFRKPLSFKVPAGPWVVRIALPRTVLPGAYRVTLTGKAGAAATAPASARPQLKPPPEGVVSTYAISSAKGGPDSASFTGDQRALYLRFRFAAVPRRGMIHLAILGPGGIRAIQDFRRQAVIATRIRNNGRPLARGRWRFVLRTGKAVVIRASVRLR